MEKMKAVLDNTMGFRTYQIQHRSEGVTVHQNPDTGYVSFNVSLHQVEFKDVKIEMRELSRDDGTKFKIMTIRAEHSEDGERITGKFNIFLK